MIDPTANGAPVESLDDLAGAVDSVAAGGLPEMGAAPSEAPQGPDYAAEARECVQLVGAVWAGLVPPVAGVFTPAAVDRAGGALAPVFEKYGLSMAVLGPEIMAAVVVGPMILQAGMITKLWIAAQKAAGAAPRPPVAPEPAPDAGGPVGGPEAAPLT